MTAPYILQQITSYGTNPKKPMMVLQTVGTFKFINMSPVK